MIIVLSFVVTKLGFLRKGVKYVVLFNLILRDLFLDPDAVGLLGKCMRLSPV